MKFDQINGYPDMLSDKTRPLYSIRGNAASYSYQNLCLYRRQQIQSDVCKKDQVKTNIMRYICFD